jgi:hypothetical protein
MGCKKRKRFFFQIYLYEKYYSMPLIKWNAPKFWYEVGWRPFVPGANPEPFMTQRVYPPQNQFPIPNPALNMRYQYYVKAVNQQPGGTFDDHLDLFHSN